MTMSNRSRPRASTSSTARAPAIPFPTTTSFCFDISMALPPGEGRRRRPGACDPGRRHLLDADRADLELGHAGHWVERGIGHALALLAGAPVERREHRIEADVGSELCLHHRAAPPRGEPRLAPAAMRGACAVAGWISANRFRLRLGELLDAAGLRPGLVLRQHAAGGQEIAGSRRRGLRPGGVVLDRMEARAVRRCRESDRRTGAACRDGRSSGHGQNTPSSRAIRS